MDLCIYIPTLEDVQGSVPGIVGFATFDLMGNGKPFAHQLHPLEGNFALHLRTLMGDAERVWVGPTLGATMALAAFTDWQHPQLRDAETLMSFLPHLPYEYPRGGSSAECAQAMAIRLRSCIDALLSSDL